MELDDLKKPWKETTATPSADAIKEAIEKRISTFRRSGRGIRNTFAIEMTIVALIYLGFFLMMWFLQEGIQTYMYNIVAITTITTIPVVWRLYKSQRWITSMDYTVDVRTNLEAFVRYFKRSLLIYEWATYAVVAIIGVMLFFDNDFQALPLGVKTTVGSYVIVVTALTRPYIRIAYGRKIKVFESFLQE
jgi:hypothetical protein